MKRIFIIIIVFITVSLLGLLFIQYSWLKNIVEKKKEDLESKIEVSAYNSLNRLVQTTLQRPQENFDLFDEPVFLTLKSKKSNPTLLEKIGVAQLREELAMGFKRDKIPLTNFEFQLSSTTSTDFLFAAQIHSPGFPVAFHSDSSNYSSFLIPISPGTGSTYESIIPDHILRLMVSKNAINVLPSLSGLILGALVFTAIMITTFYITVRTMLKQKKLSEIKSDFINNMTHEFKTPIATISLAVDALKTEKVKNDPEKMGYFANIIKEENKRMNKQVETILQAAQLDKEELQLNIKKIHAHDIITQNLNQVKLNLQETNGKLEVNLRANNDLIKADEVHFNNLVRNLIDNALKYCKPDVPVQIILTTSSIGRMFRLDIEDNGIGMSRETLARIFEKFYRAHTGNVHNVKGFGLGLTYVKAIVDAHNGKIKVDSQQGKGSVFTIELPLA
jgi:two-component system, OmpR family, phosphate regulon sensor histidine kinase PhoR